MDWKPHRLNKQFFKFLRKSASYSSVFSDIIFTIASLLPRHILDLIFITSLKQKTLFCTVKLTKKAKQAEKESFTASSFTAYKTLESLRILGNIRIPAPSTSYWYHLQLPALDISIRCLILKPLMTQAPWNSSWEQLLLFACYWYHSWYQLLVIAP